MQYLTVRKSKNGNLNQLIWDWSVKVRSRNFVVTGPILQEKARELTKEMDFATFKASNGWLQACKKPYSAKSSMLSGEAANVRNADVEKWKLRLPKLRKGYSLDNIFNANETGLFYSTLVSCFISFYSFILLVLPAYCTMVVLIKNKAAFTRALHPASITRRARAGLFTLYELSTALKLKRAGSAGKQFPC